MAEKTTSIEIKILMRNEKIDILKLM